MTRDVAKAREKEREPLFASAWGINISVPGMANEKLSMATDFFVASALNESDLMSSPEASRSDNFFKKA